jgi:hypothetical protein
VTRPCADCESPVTFRTVAGRYCAQCRWRHRGKRRLYVWTPERDQVLRERYYVEGRCQARALARIIGWPDWAITRRAQELGLTRAPIERRAWTPEEEAFLLEHAGSRHVRWMARQLGRGLTATVLKLKRMRISRRWREGYTLRELVACFGVDHKVIRRWIVDGKLDARRRGLSSDETRDGWYVTDAGILRFLQAHPLLFPLSKVDQVWFMDLILGGALMRRALAAAAEGEEETA